MITISERAATKIKTLIGDQAGKVLRIKVVGGGCSGLQYKMLVDDPKPGDKTFERDGVTVASDRKSFLYLSGTELDYSESLMESGFKFNNPNVKKSCGCGASFSI